MNRNVEECAQVKIVYTPSASPPACDRLGCAGLVTAWAVKKSKILSGVARRAL